MKTKSNVAKAKPKTKVAKPLNADQLTEWFRNQIEEAICGTKATMKVRAFAKAHDKAADVDLGGVWDAHLNLDDIVFSIMEYIMEEIDSTTEAEED